MTSYGVKPTQAVRKDTPNVVSTFTTQLLGIAVLIKQNGHMLSGKVKKTKKFAEMKRMLSLKDSRIKTKEREKKKRKKANPQNMKIREFYVTVNGEVVFVFLHLVKDIKHTIVDGIPYITDCVMAELEKLGSKYRVALRTTRTLIKVDSGHSSQEVKVDSGHSSQEVKVDSGHSSQEVKVDSGHSSQEVKVDSGHSSQEVKVDSGHSSQKVKVDSGHSSQKVKVDSSHSSQEVKVDSGHSSQEVKVDNGHSSQEVKVDSGHSSQEVKMHVHNNYLYNHTV
ncbi:hypothetical protein KUTeg_014351 [Tegillarca granosa]|uniref:Uncharacterized protein n=1 Tax=Tegillarca granosa TaxID=220873 RepID=A0ABQ9F0S4_TEGGR|nr:hypothetical protein KUTeg_014351 [Tegillarca granosa]